MFSFILLFCLALFFFGCTTSTTGATVSPVTPEHVVDITSYSYDPLILNISSGDTVTWVNKDDTPHTITVFGEFDSGTLGRRHRFSHLFTTPGVYEYHDLFFDERKGKVIVK